jgi:starch synthase
VKEDLTVLLVSPEVAPFAKTGGLADVAGALPLALKRLVNEVRVVLPLYLEVRKKNLALTPVAQDISVMVGRYRRGGAAYQTDLNKAITVYLLENDTYYDRDKLYGTSKGDYHDNTERFTFFCKGALELCRKINFRPDIIHCHDWQTALIPAYLKTIYRDDPFFARTATVFTIHNIGYQGLFEKDAMEITGLPADAFTMNGVEFYGKVNFLKAGIVYSEVINTVSKKYSEEIQTPEFGFGLDGILRYRSEDLFGILNGVDYDEWNPESDRFIAENFSLKRLAGKRACKLDLMKEFKISDQFSNYPFVGVISRLADQKGFDLLAQIINDMMKLNLVFVLLGTGDQNYHDLFNRVSKEFPGRTGIRIGFDNALAHKIEAGCDMFLMPSRYEPCGLNQMYSLKYGTIPVVRATGGLDDTIKNFDPKTGKGNGFKFTSYAAQDLFAKIREAVALYADQNAWMQVTRNAMSADFSWGASAKQYRELYAKALLKRQGKVR